MRRGLVPGALSAIAVVAVVLSAVACTKRARTDLPKYDPARYAGTFATPAPSPTAAPLLDFANGADWAIIVRKAERTLTLYRGDEQIKVYPVVLGIAPEGAKTYQGDLRTPEGVYRITFKRPHERWSRFMLLSYPNHVDMRRYAMARTDGRVPMIEGREPGPGGAVGIHGTDREADNVRGIDWTWGCVSLMNAHVDELYDLVPIGTPVLIEE
jgi:murein L,D-transpeptidase YafK